MTFLENLTRVVGEQLTKLAGHLMTRLTAQVRPETQLGRATGTLSTADGINLTLSSGNFPATAVPTTIVRILSGALAGQQRAISSGGGPGNTAVVAPAFGSAFTNVSWEVVRPADTTIPVETTLYFEDAGAFVVDGVRHRYTGRTPTSLTGVEHWDGTEWLSGVSKVHEPGEVLVDYTRNYSALDKLRRSFFIEYAEGEDLSIYGDNHGRPRPVGLDDDEIHRAYLRATMFGAQGTREFIWNVLDAVVGAGDWESFEDFTSPTDDFARIFVRRLDEAEGPEGRAYLDGAELAPATSTTEVTLAAVPLQVGSVAIAPDISYRLVAEGTAAATVDGTTITGPAGHFSSRIRRGDLIEAISGPLAGEAGRVLARVSAEELTLGHSAGFPLASLPGASALFSWRVWRESTDCRYARPSDDVALEWPGDAGTQAWEWQGTLAEADGAVLVADATNGDRLALGVATIFLGDTAYYRRQIRITAESRATFELLMGPAPDTVDSATDGRQSCFEILDGERAISVGWFLNDASTSKLCFMDADTGAPLINLAFVPALTIFTEGYRSIRIEKRGRDRAVLYVNGRHWQTIPYASLAATTDRELRVGTRSTTAPAFMNLREMHWTIDTPTDFWAARSTAATSTSGNRNIGDLGGMLVPGDAGKVLAVRGGNARNAAGGTANGLFAIEAYVNANTATVIGQTRPGLTFRRGFPNRVFFPEDFPISFPDSLGYSVQVLEGPHAGTYPLDVLFGAEDNDLTRRPDGVQFDGLLVSTGGDAAIRDYAVSADVTGAPAGGFTATDGEYAWRLVPVFPTDSALVAELADCGTQAGADLTLRQALPISSPLPLLEVEYTRVNSAHAEAEDADNEGDLTPFYLWDAWGLLRPVVEAACAEGIDVDIDSLQRDAAGLHIVEE